MKILNLNTILSIAMIASISMNASGSLADSAPPLPTPNPISVPIVPVAPPQAPIPIEPPFVPCVIECHIFPLTNSGMCGVQCHPVGRPYDFFNYFYAANPNGPNGYRCELEAEFPNIVPYFGGSSICPGGNWSLTPMTEALLGQAEISTGTGGSW